MCLIKSDIHKNNLDKPFIAENNIVVYKALDNYDLLNGRTYISTPFRYFPIIFDNGKCVMNEPMMDTYGIIINRGIHAYTTEQECKKTCDFFYDNYGMKKFWAVIPKGSKYFVGECDEIVSDNLIIFRTKNDFRKYKKEHECINLNLELSK